MIFDIENWLWKSDLGTFWRPMWTSVKVKSKNYFAFTDFFAKIQACRPWVCHGTQILADQLTLFQPGGTDFAHLITTRIC